jgi:hypothetical protein
VAGCVSLWLVLDSCGTSWGRCRVVPCFSNYDVRIIYGNVRIFLNPSELTLYRASCLF